MAAKMPGNQVSKEEQRGGDFGMGGAISREI
jgi:hypothetical protein